MTEIRKYLAEIGRAGGLKSRRRLDPDTARQTVRVREARRAFQRFHAECFWPSPPDLAVGAADVSWVAEQLQKHGGADAWRVAGKLCR